MSNVKIIECPRDAMQGLKDFIPTEIKVAYLNKLLKVGFDTLDFGSFVSPKAIPQMRDTHSLLSRLELDETETKLLAIVANFRGAETACEYDEIQYLGFPFSVSETFQKRNTNSTPEAALGLVEEIHNLCEMYGKELVVYISMAFGNPYGDPWHMALVEHWIDRIESMGVKIISIADTVGLASPPQIAEMFQVMSINFPKTEFGAHLHTTPDNWEAKVHAAFENGCMRFDGAIKGFGGCPMAKDELVGNMPTENLISYLNGRDQKLGLDLDAFNIAVQAALGVFP